MERRQFLAAGIGTIGGLQGLTLAAQTNNPGERQYFELRLYHTLVGSKKNLVGDFYRDAGIPAMNRIGMGPVGVFNVMYGPNNPTLYVLMVHKSIESVVNASSLLMEDKEYLEKGASYINAPLSDPAYVRFESSLMAAFTGMPKLEAPARKNRIFELRIYESHSRKAAKKKIEMFNEGGEIAIFHKAGLTPVFFGETIIGQKLPNLMYMLAFDDIADRDKRWESFRNEPDWKKLSADPAYKDTVSNITDIILQPMPYSQI
jgi:hypothetical protein